MPNIQRQLATALQMIQKLQKQTQRTKAKKMRKPAAKTAGTGSEAHLRLLSAVGKAQPINAESFGDLAKKNGYAKGKGSGAAFRGRNATLKYIIRKEVILTKHGEEILMQARLKAEQKNAAQEAPAPTNQPPEVHLPAIEKAEAEQRNEQVLETVPQDGR